jgi:hypothetical protein
MSFHFPFSLIIFFFPLRGLGMGEDDWEGGRLVLLKKGWQRP